MAVLTVIIPTYNRAHLVERAILSVLSQKCADFEILISDNCSSDSTRSVIEKYSADRRVSINFNDENLGMVGNWKKCIFDLVQTPWFILMSDDDYFVDDYYIRDVITAIEQHRPKMVFAAGFVSYEPEGNRATLELLGDGLTDGRKIFMSRGTVKPQDMLLCNIAFQRDDSIRLGFLDDSNDLCCDSKLFLNLCLEGSVYLINRPVCVYTLHGNNLITKLRSVKLYLASSVDHLLVPYARAKANNVPEHILKSYERNTNLKMIMRKTLWRLMVNDYGLYKSTLQRLRTIDDSYVRENYFGCLVRICSFFVYCFRSVLSKFFPAS